MEAVENFLENMKTTHRTILEDIYADDDEGDEDFDPDFLSSDEDGDDLESDDEHSCSDDEVEVLVKESESHSTVQDAMEVGSEAKKAPKCPSHSRQLEMISNGSNTLGERKRHTTEACSSTD